MDTNITQIASATVALIAPFMPYLIEVSKESGKKFVEVITEKGGEAVWNNVKTLWEKIEKYFGEDEDIQDAARMLSRKPEDKKRRVQLAEFLAERLEADADLAKEFASIIGGKSGIQRILASEGSWVENVEQYMLGNGEQIIEAKKKSTIKNAKQSIIGESDTDSLV